MALLSGGGYSDVAACHKDHIIEIPDNFEFKEAAAIPETWLTSYQLLNLVANSKRGDTALIHAAASGVGCASLQLCRMQGIKTIAVASTSEKLENAAKLGASHGINYNSKNNPDFSDLVREYTNGKGVDVILDCIGAQNLDYNLASAAIDCKWVFYGALGGVKVQNINLGKFLSKRIQFISSTLKNRSDEYKTDLIKRFTRD